MSKRPLKILPRIGISPDLFSKKWIIWGTGVTGVAVINFLVKLGLSQAAGDFVVLDSTNQDDSNLQHLFLEDCVVVISPGIDPKNPKLTQNPKLIVIGEIELAYWFCTLPIIAITGTNGKTTTSMLTAHYLKKAGVKVFLAGNIGVPYIDLVFQQDQFQVVVLELSSFQLETIMHFKPNYAAIITFSMHHQERYKKVEEYFLAKANIFKNIHPLKEKRSIVDYEDVVSLFDQDFPGSPLIGSHNKQNCAWASVLAQRFLVDFHQSNTKAQNDWCKDFIAPAHRLEKLEQNPKYADLMAINDSKSTNLTAFNVALKAVFDTYTQANCFIHLILGGKIRDSNAPIDLADLIRHPRIGVVLLFGHSRFAIFDHLKVNNFNMNQVELFENLEQLMETLQQKKLKGVLLFSPAYPSYDQYKNFEYRGDHFKNLWQRA